MTRIFVIRHAEAEGNLYRRAHGQYDSLVTKMGYHQIELLRKRFENEHVDAVYSSTLFRARTTALAVSESRALDIVTSRDLMEANLGRWEDTLWGEIEYSEPQMLGFFSNDPANWKIDGGEDFYNVIARMKRRITDIAKSHEGETVAIVSHGFAIRSFLCDVMGVPSNETAKVPHCDNTAVSELHYENGALKLVYAGDNSHLPKESSTLEQQKWWRGDAVSFNENTRMIPFDKARDGELFCLLRSESEPYAYEHKLWDLDRVAANTSTGAVMTAFSADTPIGIIEMDLNTGEIVLNRVLKSYSAGRIDVQLIGQAVYTYRKLGIWKLMKRIESCNAGALEFCIDYGFEPVTSDGGITVLEKDIRRAHVEVR